MIGDFLLGIASVGAAALISYQVGYRQATKDYLNWRNTEIFREAVNAGISQREAEELIEELRVR
jgi:hypothetical protein